nr:UBN2 domain-containing protein [Tanacetum cinerariifolium]
MNFRLVLPRSKTRYLAWYQKECKERCTVFFDKRELVDIMKTILELGTQGLDILEEESIDSGYARFNTIITSLLALDESFSSKNYVRNFLRALHPNWRAKVMTIKESNFFSSLALKELIGKGHDDLKVQKGCVLVLRFVSCDLALCFSYAFCLIEDLIAFCLDCVLPLRFEVIAFCLKTAFCLCVLKSLRFVSGGCDLSLSLILALRFGGPDLLVLVPESFHKQTDEELIENDVKRMDADDQAI